MGDLLFEKKDGVAVVTFNRPAKKNAFTPEMVVNLADAWTEFRDDETLRVAILTGNGDTFSAGADLGRLIPLLTRARPLYPRYGLTWPDGLAAAAATRLRDQLAIDVGRWLY